jgi:hypothetical protein
MKAKRVKVKKEDDSDAEDDNVSESGSVNDEEFDAYLDSLGAAGGKNDVDDDYDFMGEVSKPTTKKRKHASDDEESGQDDWDVSDNEGEAEKPEKKKLKFDVDEGEMSDDGSISLDDEDEIMGSSDSDDDASVIMNESDDDSESESDEDQPKTKNRKLSVAEKLKKKLKSDDMDSLFVGTDEFAEMLEASAKSKHHGTSEDIRNQDKSSDKQMKWESGRMQDLGEMRKRKFNPQKNGARKSGGRPFEKKDGGGRKFGKKPGFKKDFKKTFKPGSNTKNFKQARFNKPTRR